MTIDVDNAPHSHTSTLSAAERKRIRARLDDDLRELSDTQAQLRAEIAAALVGRRGVGTDESEDPEGSSLAFEQAQTISLLDQSERHGAEIVAALARIDAGTYGACQRCGGAISAGRLEARPFAALCIACAS